MCNKSTLILVVVILCTVMLTACSHQAQENKETSNQVQTEQNLLTKQSHYPLTLSVYTDEGKRKYRRQLQKSRSE
ncbi:hypothetical protein [Paenibacillus sp. KS1]|uniref:hypothetical protein n=1 Tax=Paenibacillus sp. KS1 TaxID=1849249 RepID=UPI001C2FBA49|nr:hypothetical protein [Paenibacillus sp. KS1]